MATEQTIFSATVPLNTPCDVLIRVSGKQNYSNVNGLRPWQLRIYWDGNLVNYGGGAGGITDAPYVEAALTGCASGNHSLLITWQGDATMYIRGVNAVVEWFKK